MSLEEKNKEKRFKRRLDFYWQFVAVYSVALILYALIKSFASNYKVSLNDPDPIMILLALFVAASISGLIYQTVRKRSIRIGEDYIAFKSRRGEKIYPVDSIIHIKMSKDRKFRTKKPPRVVKIYVPSRRRPISIRPGAYWDESELTRELARLRKIVRRNEL